jgi:hypothetical protein
LAITLIILRKKQMLNEKCYSLEALLGALATVEKKLGISYL